MSKLEDRIAAIRGGAPVSLVTVPASEALAPNLTSMPLSSERYADPDGLMLFIGQIQTGPQARKQFRNIELLAANINQHGLMQPIVVRELSAHRYMLLAGERRLRAVRDVLKHDTISARVIRTANDEQAWRLSQLSENLQREEYEPLELAREFAVLKEHFRYTDATLADALQLSRTWVWKQLSLLSAPEAVQQAIDEGRLAATDYLNNKAKFTTDIPNTRHATTRSAGVTLQRVAAVSLPTPSTMEVARLLQVLAEKQGLSPITLGENPSKKELTAIVTSRVTEILNAIKTDVV